MSAQRRIQLTYLIGLENSKRHSRAGGNPKSFSAFYSWKAKEKMTKRIEDQANERKLEFGQDHHRSQE
jgi:hypothetical protein